MEIVFNTAKEIEQYLGKERYKEFCSEPYVFSVDALYETFKYAIDSYIENEEPGQAYKLVNETDFSEFSEEDLGIDTDSLIEDYETIIQKYMKDEDECDIDNSDFESITPDLIDECFVSGILEDNYNDAMEKLNIDYEQIRGYNEYGEMYENESIDEEADESLSVKTLNDLVNFDDSVGDVVSVTDDSHVDYDNRDYPFIYVDGEIFYNDDMPGMTHSELLVEFLEEHGVDEEDIPEDMLKGEIVNSRPTKKRLQRLTNAEDVAFGHVMKGIAYIETLMGNVMANTVAKICERDLDVSKVYQLDNSNFVVKRLAKTIKYKRVI